MYTIHIWTLIDSQQHLFYFRNHNSRSYALHVFDIFLEIILRGDTLRMMYFLILWITLNGYSKGQPLYKDIANDRFCDITHASYEDLYNRVSRLENHVKMLKKKGWTSFMDSEYWIGRKEETWNDARIICMINDAKLVEIESNAEDLFVRGLAMGLTNTVWLGGTDVATEGRWVWDSDRSPFTYSAWDIAKGQPNNYDNQDCLSLYRPYNITWCDEKCETRYQYICERKVI